VRSLSLVRYRGKKIIQCRPSTDTEEVLVKGYVQEVVIAYGRHMIARQTRSSGRKELDP